MTSKLPFIEILRSAPGCRGIRLEEEPRFTVLDHMGDDGAIEIRRYAPALLARVAIDGDHDAAVDEGFDRLVRHIFGEHAPAELAALRGEGGGERLAMTIPVRQEPATGRWTIGFFLSNDLEAAGAPLDAEIELVREPVRVVAVLRYGGDSSDERRLAATRELLAALAADSRWRADDEVSWAEYDAPFVVPFVRRNEAQVAVTRRAEH